MVGQAISLPFRRNQIERSPRIRLGDQKVAPVAVLHDCISGRGVPGDYDCSVWGCEAVAKGTYVAMANCESGDGDIRILEDHTTLDLLHIYLPSRVVRVLQTLSPDLPG